MLVGTSRVRVCIGTSVYLKEVLRRESNAALAKTHVQLHKRQQLAREARAGERCHGGVDREVSPAKPR